MAHGPSAPRAKIVGPAGAVVDTGKAGQQTVLLVLDQEARATLGGILQHLETIAALMQIIAGGGES